MIVLRDGLQAAPCHLLVERYEQAEVFGFSLTMLRILERWPRRPARGTGRSFRTAAGRERARWAAGRVADHRKGPAAPAPPSLSPNEHDLLRRGVAPDSPRSRIDPEGSVLERPAGY